MTPDMLFTVIGFAGLLTVMSMIVFIFRMGSIQAMIEDGPPEEPEERDGPWRYYPEDFD